MCLIVKLFIKRYIKKVINLCCILLDLLIVLADSYFYIEN